MSKVVNIPYTYTTSVTGYDDTNSTYYQQASGYPAENGLGDGTGTYAGFHLTRGSNAETKVWYTYDCSSIPNDATITSVTCTERASMSTKTTTQVSTATLQLYAGTTAKGSATSILVTTAQFFDVNGGSNWTVAEIKNCRLLGYAKRGTRNQNSQYTMRLFGGVLTVNYTIQGIQYTITATSEVEDETVDPTTQDIYAGENAYVNIRTESLTNKIVTDNGNNVTDQLVYMPADTGKTVDQYPSGYATGGSGTISGLHYVNTIGCSVDNPSSETQVDSTTTGGTTAIIYYKFDFSDIPESATISSMTIQVRYKVSNTNYAQSVNTYSGTTSKGTAVTLNSTSFTTTTISSPGTWTAAQLRDDPRIGLTLSYSGALIIGITWSVTYTADVPAYYRYNLTNLSTDHTILFKSTGGNNYLYVKLNGTWTNVSKIYHKENGSWVEKLLTYLTDENITNLIKGN